MNKQGINIYEDWAEYLTLSVLIVGMVLSLLSDAAVITYIIGFLCGFFIGRLFRLRRYKIRFPFYMVVAGFIVGFVLGIWFRDRGSIVITLVVLAAGIYIGDVTHKKKIFK